MRDQDPREKGGAPEDMRSEVPKGSDVNAGRSLSQTSRCVSRAGGRVDHAVARRPRKMGWSCCLLPPALNAFRVSSRGGWQGAPCRAWP